MADAIECDCDFRAVQEVLPVVERDVEDVIWYILYDVQVLLWGRSVVEWDFEIFKNLFIFLEFQKD